MAPVWRILARHPKYLDTFVTAHQYVLRGAGPLRYPDRHYIAMMVSSKFIWSTYY